MLHKPTILSSGVVVFIFQSCIFLCVTTHTGKACLNRNNIIPFKDDCFFSQVTLKRSSQYKGHISQCSLDGWIMMTVILMGTMQIK